jgi:hypothetical protein
MAVQVPNAWAAWLGVPVVLTVEGPYGSYVTIAYKVGGYVKAILLDSVEWLSAPGGLKTLMIRIPDAVSRIADRRNPPVSLPGKMLFRFAHFIKPLRDLGGCAKPFLAFAEVAIKTKTLLTWSRPHNDYFVVDNLNRVQRAQLPLNIWQQGFNMAANAAHWIISVNECEAFLSKRSGSEAVPYISSIAAWGIRYVSIKDLCFEGWFLYQTWWLGNHQRFREVNANNGIRKEYVHLRAPIAPDVQDTTIATQEIVGSLLKISLAVACLSLDIFTQMAKRGNKSPWLETALFWTSLAPTFITPIAMRYWPNLAIKPLGNPA